MFDYTSFNPSVGIAFIQTPRTPPTGCARSRFNPSVGIAFIQTACHEARADEFSRFNPSVGIAFIQTKQRGLGGLEELFQSLSRDSVYSNEKPRLPARLRGPVSIPQSG